jgi:endonuclease/exonuclease/phosphatase family metal-dependent hydrolase
MKIKQTLLTCLAAACFLSPGSVAQATDTSNTPIKVMSFNIRYGAANDGTNSWPHRQNLVLETIQNFNPDLLGLQEVLKFQAEFLQSGLPGYAFHGVGREDGAEKGEFVPLMFRKDRFELLDAGHFWLSETPEIAGSVSWDSSLTRMLSWVALRDRHNETELVFANVHFDHRGQQARLESAKLIRRRAADIPYGVPVILTGDFNTTEDDAPYAALVKGEGFSGNPWVDTYRVIQPQRFENEASFNGWQGTRKGSRIDWIVTTPDVKTLDARVNYTQEDGRNPSDHYPVEAILRLK